MSTKPISAIEVPGFEKLTPREQAFVQHPDVYRDPRKAATEVGYSTSTIEKRAHSMRQRLMRFIQPAFEHKYANLGVDRRRVEDELACLAFTIEDEFKERIDIETTDGGVESVTVWKDPSQLPEHMRRAIKSVEWGYETDADGNTHQSDRPVHITLYSKEKALKELAGLFGDVAPKNPVDEQQELFDNLDIADRETLVRIHMKAARRASLKQQPIEGTNAQREEPVRRLTPPSGSGSDADSQDPGRRRASTRDKPSDAPVPVARRRVDSPAAPRRARAPAVLDVSGDDSDVGYTEVPD